MKNISKKSNFGICLIVYAFVLVLTCSFIVDKKAEAAGLDQPVTYATVKSVTDFRNYIDNNNPCSIQEEIEEDWSGTTEVYKLVIPSSGKLLVCPLSQDGHVKATVYSDFALTMEKLSADALASDRDDIAQTNISAGTYYVRGERWNGTNPIQANIFIGFIPDNAQGVEYADTSVKYDAAQDVDAKDIAVTGDAELLEKVKANQYVSSDNVETSWSGTTDVHSIKVTESGWLLVYPVEQEGCIDLFLYSDKACASSILKAGSYSSADEKPYACYVTPGNYYWKGIRWNGTGLITMYTYMGFVSCEGRLDASVVNNSDNTAATVTFSGSDVGKGLLRVEKGEYDPSIISSTKFWNTSDRANAVEGTVKTITQNGTYVARLEDANGYHTMVSFTVSGLIEPQPIVTPPTPIQATSTIKPALTPVSKIYNSSTYKISVKKKSIVVKVKKKARISYTVTKGYTGKVKFSTSNKKIASVSKKGIVKGKKKGKCKITLKLNNGQKATVNVKVKK